ncbi:uncharacterized protein PAC_18169 [Phialocephala subalpina]|uniref:Rhomboid family membrane protein n=1 Tax=Phialocephala subalpina TaxID=576137 RepID=A0A1L7XTA2_9HELO|nr:uncharacterized protein PAC_18169 [Phialocephala subalpina]
MATTTPQKPPSTSNPAPSRDDILRWVSYGALFVCPIIILIPPRKLDIYTLALLGGTFYGGNQVSRELTGISMLQRIQNRANTFADSGLPPKALEMQKRLKEEKEWRDQQMKGGFGRSLGREEVKSGEPGGVLAEVERKREQEEKERVERGLLEKLWMGEEGEDWKVKRDQREKEALDEGRGYGGLIMDQIWEVWNWGKDKNEEVKEIDEKVVAEKKTEEKKR